MPPGEVKPKRAAARGRPSARAPGPPTPIERVRIHKGALDVGGREVPLHAGAMHYWRLERSAWRDGLLALRDMGLTLVETYVPWGVHETAPGKFELGETDPQRDLGAFVDLAGEVGLYVWLRPGPHINAEMTYFGLPERIVYDRACQARGPEGQPVLQGFPPRMFPVPSYASSTFHDEAGRWLDAFAEVVRPRLHPRGPVVLLQVDNEASLYFRDGVYDQDYHPDALRHWYAFLEARYGNVAAMARAHRSEASSFEVAPPTRFDAADDDSEASEPNSAEPKAAQLSASPNSAEPKATQLSASPNSAEPKATQLSASPNSAEPNATQLSASPNPEKLAIHFDWAAHQETLITDAVVRMRARMEAAGLVGVPFTHNLPLGELGSPASLAALEHTAVDVCGLDYYHARAEHRIVKRRTLYLAGTSRWPISPELGVGAPPWFTPLTPADSFFTAMSVLAWGVRGFSLYMAVDRDRWYGAPIDRDGKSRHDAERWKHLVGALQRTQFHRLRRRADVALMIPREYQRLSRATNVLGFVTPTWLDAVGGSPVDGASEDTFGFEGPIQVLWWRMLQKMQVALGAAGVPYVLCDSDLPESRLEERKVIVAPSFEIADPQRHKLLAARASAGTRVLYGPALPSLDTSVKKRPFEVPDGGQLIALDTPDDAADVVATLVARDPALVQDVRCTDPEIEVSVHEDDTGPRVVFVLHAGKGDTVAALEVEDSWALEDLMTGERYEGEGRVRVPMGPGTARMLRVAAVRTPKAVGVRSAPARRRATG